MPPLAHCVFFCPSHLRSKLLLTGSKHNCSLSQSLHCVVLFLLLAFHNNFSIVSQPVLPLDQYWVVAMAAEMTATNTDSETERQQLVQQQDVPQQRHLPQRVRKRRLDRGNENTAQVTHLHFLHLFLGLSTIARSRFSPGSSSLLLSV